MSQRKKSGKVTTSHKVALGALSVLGAVAGWNAIGRSQPEAQAAGKEAPPAATVAPVVSAGPTPWPAIAPLAEMPRIDARRAAGHGVRSGAARLASPRRG